MVIISFIFDSILDQIIFREDMMSKSIEAAKQYISENNYEEDYLQMVVSFGDYADARYVEGRTFELLNPTGFPGTDDGQIGLLGGEGFSRVPSTPVVKNLSPTVEGSILKISYEAEVR